MKQIIENLSNRELSIFIWVGLIVIALLFSKGTRKSLLGVLRAFFNKKIISIFLGLIFYVYLIAFIFYKFHFWNIGLLKDTIFWFFTVALVLFFKINDAKDSSFFNKIIFESLKLTILLEFIVNFYNFNLVIEIILTPILLIVILTQAYAEVYSDKNPEFKKISKFLNTVLTFILLVYMVYSLYLTIAEYSKLLTLNNLYSLLLPPIFTILIIPVLYFITVYMNYETLYIRIQFMFNDENVKHELKMGVFKYARFNLNKLMRIDKNLNKLEIYLSKDVKKYIKELTQK